MKKEILQVEVLILAIVALVAVVGLVVFLLPAEQPVAGKGGEILKTAQTREAIAAEKSLLLDEFERTLSLCEEQVQSVSSVAPSFGEAERVRLDMRMKAFAQSVNDVIQPNLQIAPFVLPNVFFGPSFITSGGYDWHQYGTYTKPSGTEGKADFCSKMVKALQVGATNLVKNGVSCGHWGEGVQKASTYDFPVSSPSTTPCIFLDQPTADVDGNDFMAICVEPSDGNAGYLEDELKKLCRKINKDEKLNKGPEFNPAEFGSEVRAICEKSWVKNLWVFLWTPAGNKEVTLQEGEKTKTITLKGALDKTFQELDEGFGPDAPPKQEPKKPPRIR